MKVTNADLELFVKTKLEHNHIWALKALIEISRFQTSEELENEVTRFINGVGFTGVDAKILTSFAKQYQSRGWLSQKQMEILHKRIPKYWKQIVAISDKEKLEQAITSQLSMVFK
ncbi:MAG: hypothetical protein WC319_14955 [Candidatus Paceibacterota bacterium]|jgi:hypothetical protein